MAARANAEVWDEPEGGGEMNHISYGIYEEFEEGKWENIKTAHKLEIIVALLGEVSDVLDGVVDEVKEITRLHPDFRDV